MNTYFLSRYFILGLSAYLRRLELSVDRTLRDKIGPLKNYCEGLTSPTLQEVIARFDSISEYNAIERLQSRDASIQAGHFYSLLKFRTQWFFRGGIILKETEMLSIYSTLKNLEVALNQHEMVDPSIFVPIRTNLSEVANFCLLCIPHRHLREKISQVEHLNQNPILKTVTTSEITNRENWLADRICRA